MDPSLAIQLTDISKKYRIVTEDTSKEKSTFNKNPTKTVDHTVLDKISLSVKKGEMIGIIGLNGSGKSTLLSIMARIMEPDSGTVETSGKVASILELGMGFHPDLSGRENIYIKGEMYGFSKKEIDERIDSIIDFAGLREYIDSPLRTYSSGMSGRLAFAVMVNVNADVMLLDEIMSTGDPSYTIKANALFHKQLTSGKTVVFASQNSEQIEQLCSRAIWINKGKIVADGPAKSVVAQFKNAINDSIEVITDLAGSGVADAQYKLALLFRDGGKIGKDEGLYKMWLGKAARQGHAAAQVAYADILINGTDQERAEAAIFYQSAAAKGNNEAKMKISAAQSGGTADRDEIRAIFRQLAEIGHPSEKYQYAMLMLRSAWTEEDRHEALEWFTRSAEEDGNPDSMLQIAYFHRDGIGVPKDNAKYIEYLEKAEKMGNPDACRLLADIYRDGRITVKDDKKAFEYYLKGSKFGYSGMMYQLANMYQTGAGTEVNEEEAQKWFKLYADSVLSNYQIRAADLMKFFDIKTDATPESLLRKSAAVGNFRAICLLADMYRGDNYSVPNPEEAKRYYEYAALWPGQPRANLADFLYKGYMYNQNLKRSFELYSSSSYACNPLGDFRLYQMYHNGLGTEKNEELAMKFLERSARRGNPDAKVVLKNLRKE